MNTINTVTVLGSIQWDWVLISEDDERSGTSSQAFYFRGEVSKCHTNYAPYGQHVEASPTSRSAIASWTPQSPSV
jgi:hypothetical protein